MNYHKYLRQAQRIAKAIREFNPKAAEDYIAATPKRWEQEKHKHVPNRN